jgi:hypothetical protein
MTTQTTNKYYKSYKSLKHAVAGHLISQIKIIYGVEYVIIKNIF